MLTVRLRTGSKEKQSAGQTIRQMPASPTIKNVLKGRQTDAGFPHCKNHFEKEDLSCRQMKIQLH